MNKILSALSAVMIAGAPCAAQSEADFFRQLAEGGHVILGQARAQAQSRPLFQKVDYVKPQDNPTLKKMQAERQALLTQTASATLIVRVETADGSHGTGAGVIVDPAGLALTNAHVAGAAANGTVDVEVGPALVKRKAKVLAVAPGRDIAVLQIVQEGSAKADWPALVFGTLPDPGAMVFAVGNPANQGFTVTAGDVGQSANTTMNPWVDMLQMSIELNPGNSGGPLVDISGRLVGMNTSIMRSRVVNGIGFAIPATVLQAALAEYRSSGKLVDGATSLDLTSNMMVSGVEAGSAPDKAGLKIGDAIVSFPGSDTLRPDQLPSALVRQIAHAKVGQIVPVSVVRGLDGVMQTAEPKAAKPAATFPVHFNPALGVALAVPGGDAKSAAAWVAFAKTVTKTSEEKLLINGKLYETEQAGPFTPDGGIWEIKGWTPSGARVSIGIPVEEYKVQTKTK